MRHNEIKLLDFKGKTEKIKPNSLWIHLGLLSPLGAVSALLVNGNSSKVGVPADHKDHFFFFLLTLAM